MAGIVGRGGELCLDVARTEAATTATVSPEGTARSALTRAVSGGYPGCFRLSVAIAVTAVCGFTKRIRRFCGHSPHSSSHSVAESSPFQLS